MKKLYVKMEDRNEQEAKTGYASYKRVIERHIQDLVLCNNIVDVDPSIWDNMGDNAYFYVDEDGEYRTKEEYDNDTTGEIHEEFEEFYQYYLCNVSNYDLKMLKEYGIIMSYSDMLDCDVLCVSHCGTSWDYVSTDVELTENIEEAL